MTQTGPFEAHITLYQLSAEVEALASAAGFSSSYIVNDPVLGPGRKAYLTKNGDSSVIEEMEKLANHPDILPHVLRTKAEVTVFDKRYAPEGTP